MTINSILFLVVFLPFILIYYQFRDVKWQNIFLATTCFGILVYVSRMLSIVAILLTLATYLSGRKIEQGHRKKTWMSIGVIMPVLTLSFFKYKDFFLQVVTDVVTRIGCDSGSLRILMPIGISYFVFRQISYIIDIYRGDLQSTPRLYDYCTYTFLFSNFVAGPIDKAKNFLPQLDSVRHFDYYKVVLGSRQILWGMLKKMVVADNLAIIVNNVWIDIPSHSAINLLLVGMLYTIQLYMDFSGYSDMAIGVGKIMGFDINPNFHFPFFSRNIAEFWRRWHVSLTTWFTTYLYIPLGGNRKGRWRAILNTIIVFTVCGAWHGPTFNYVLWGLFNGLLFIPIILSNGSKKYKKSSVADESLLPSLEELYRMMMTFVLFSCGFYIFHSENLANLASIVKCIAFNWSICEELVWNNYCNLAILLFIVEWITRKLEFPLFKLHYKHSTYINGLLYVIIIELILRFGSFISQGFIYGNY